MIAESPEIKFACVYCNQRISVDAAGAGMTATCPNCAQPLIVPQLGSMNDRAYREGVKTAPSRSGAASAAETNGAGALRELREALAAAERERGVAAAALAAAAEKLAAAQQARAAAETQRNLQTGQCLLLEEEIARLRHDLAEGHAGRELLALRDRFEVLEGKHQKATAALANLETAHATLTADERQLRADLTAVRERAAAAENRAEASSDSALQRDIGVLRGIIDRQKAELAERFAELRRLQRARFILRIVYALFALAFLVVIALVFVTPPAPVKHFLHDWFSM